MELDRRFVEKRDFPQSRRGYEPAAVDRHLSAIADALERLRAAPAASAAQQTLAGTAASRVEAIVAAAEASANEIEQKARAEAAATIERVAGQAERMQSEVEELIARIAALKESIDVAPASSPTAAPVAPVVTEIPDPEPASVAQAEAQVPASEARSGRSEEGARLVALNMALNGTPRAETARYLRENFDLQASEALLDDVYARAGS